MKTLQIPALLTAVIFSVVALVSLPAQADVFHFDGSVSPDDPSLAGMFSSHRDTDASWSSNGSELTLTPSNDPASDIWFGWSNFPRHGGAPSWSFAPTEVGNSLEVTCKVTLDSGYFTLAFGDGTYQSGINIEDGRVRITDANGQFSYLALDTTEYHTYSLTNINGVTTYSIDGATYTGAATALANPYMYIGDFNGAPNGSMIIDAVTINNAVPEPSSFALLFVLAVVGGAISWRKGRRATN